MNSEKNDGGLGGDGTSPPIFSLRNAFPQDCPAIARLVRALATYEKLSHEARATDQDFHQALFGDPPRAHASVAMIGREIVGFALWFYNFSTFQGRHGLYVEDVFVEPAHRGAGIGRAFFAMMAARAVAEGCARMEWSVLDWNKPAIDFYRALGAEPMTEWTVQRLSGDALHRVAASDTPRSSPLLEANTACLTHRNPSI